MANEARKAGYVVVTGYQTSESSSFALGTSAQKAACIVLTMALELSEGHKISINIDSKYVFLVLHAKLSKSQWVSYVS